jgi:hypothetical protein
MIDTDDGSGGADNCDKGEDNEDVFSALKVLSEPGDQGNVDSDQGYKNYLEPAKRFPDPISLGHAAILHAQNK